MSVPLEHDYIGLSSEIPPMEKTSEKVKNPNVVTEDDERRRSMKATELRLGLPGSESPEREEDKNGFVKTSFVVSSGAKRGFSDAIDGAGKWVLPADPDLRNTSVLFSPRGTNGEKSVVGPEMKEVPKSNQEKKPQISIASSHGVAPAAKAQVIGWPPIRSFRKNTMATNAVKKDDDLGFVCLYVKVSMDGAPYLRKVDINTYSSYLELSSALEKMFSCFTIGQFGSHGNLGRDVLSESRLMDLLHGSEYVLTMFTDSCRRLRIMKSSDAIGLAPRAIQKCKNNN
ncbi:AUX/IAA domain [Dillenia turbinata]|uniref:Auxin-responsive protein n=1 Tax=Dillenia turbinata TaxID=194707 RepID=A0AAN8W225_9MAGN